MEQILQLLGEQGVVVASFVWLLKYTLDTATSRETRLMDFLESMKVELQGVSNAITKLSDDVDELKDVINK